MQFSTLAVSLLVMPNLVSSVHQPPEPDKRSNSGDDAGEISAHGPQMASDEASRIANDGRSHGTDVVVRAEPASVTALFIVGAMVGIFGFLKDTIRDLVKKDKGSTHLLHLGTQPPWSGELTQGFEEFLTRYKNPAGRTPEIRVFDDFGRQTGVQKGRGGRFIGHGNVGGTHIKHDGQSVYSTFGVAEYDMGPVNQFLKPKKWDHQVCIGWGAKAQRGSNQYIFSGDMGAICGAYWHWSGIYVTEDRDYQPKCFWVGRYADAMPTGFQVRWPSFSEEAIRSLKDPLEYCNGVDFGIRWDQRPYNLSLNKYDPLEYFSNSTVGDGIYDELMNATRYQPNADDVPPEVINKTEIVNNYYNFHPPGSPGRRRDGGGGPPVSPRGLGSILIMDDFVKNSARELCESEMSYGSDYANDQERLFCDMDQKKLYYYCDDISKGRCFDPKEKVLKTKGVEGLFPGPDSLRRALKEPYLHVVDRREKKPVQDKKNKRLYDTWAKIFG